METDIRKDHGIRLDPKDAAGDASGEVTARPRGGAAKAARTAARDRSPLVAAGTLAGRLCAAAWTSFKQNNQVITNLGVLIGLLLTVVGLAQTREQLLSSARNFRSEMDIQQRATAVMLANEFLDQVSAIELRRRDDPHEDQTDVDTMIATRAQLMLEGFEKLSPEHQAELNAQIVRFLSSIGYGRLFQPVFARDESAIGRRNVSLNDRSFAFESLAHVDFQGASFRCLELRGATLEFTDLERATILNTTMTGATIGEGVDFGSATIQWSDMRDMTLMGEPDFSGSTIVFSDLRGLTIDEDLRETLIAKFGLDSRGLGDERKRYVVLAQLLAGARSLYGSLLDEGLVSAIEELYSNKEDVGLYRNLLSVPPESGMPAELMGSGPFDVSSWRSQVESMIADAVGCGRIRPGEPEADLMQARL